MTYTNTPKLPNFTPIRANHDIIDKNDDVIVTSYIIIYVTYWSFRVSTKFVASKGFSFCRYRICPRYKYFFFLCKNYKYLINHQIPPNNNDILHMTIFGYYIACGPQKSVLRSKKILIYNHILRLTNHT